MATAEAAFALSSASISGSDDILGVLVGAFCERRQGEAREESKAPSSTNATETYFVTPRQGFTRQLLNNKPNASSQESRRWVDVRELVPVPQRVL